MFKEVFPDFIEARHAVAHSGDRVKSEIAQQRHAIWGPWKNDQLRLAVVDNGMSVKGMLVDILSQRQYSNTWDGKIVSYEISLKTLEALAAIRDKVYQGFTPS